MRRPEKWASSREERLSSLPGGELAAVKFQRGMTQVMRIMVARQTKKIEKESINMSHTI